MNITKRLLSYFYPVTIEKRKGTHLPALEVNLRNGEYLLDGDHVNYSFGSLHDLFRQAFIQFDIKNRDIKKVLILGFGAGSVARILQKEFRMDCSITGVEIDSVMLELAGKYFHLDNYQNTQIICEDADDFVQRDVEVYDLIIVDLFVESRVPKSFVKSGFIQGVKQRLSANGFLFFNRINENALQREETKALINTINSVMDGTTETVNFHQNGIDNIILVYQNNESSRKKEKLQSVEEMEDSVLL